MRHPSTKSHRAKHPAQHYHFRLYMAGHAPNSKQALANLRRLCREHLNGNCTIETVDVVKDFAAAVKDNILVTPALIMITPGPKVTVLGNLSDRPMLLLALRLAEGDS